MILYKYLGPDRIDLLRSGMVRFTQPAALNDPFDCSPRFLDTEELDNVPQSAFCAHCGRFFVQGLQSALSEYERHSVGLLCLSEKYDNLLMWSHYADCHRGFVIGFDADHPFFSKSTDGTGLWKVSYGNMRPCIPKHVVQSEFSRQPPLDPSGLNCFLLGGDNSFNPDTDRDDYRFVKSTDWEYEQEWRLVRNLNRASKIIKADRAFDVYLYEFPKATVHSVILGFRGLSTLAPIVRKILSENSEFSHVKLFRARKNPRNFKVDVETIAPESSDSRLPLLDEDLASDPHNDQSRTQEYSCEEPTQFTKPRLLSLVAGASIGANHGQVHELLKLHNAIKEAPEDSPELCELYDRAGLTLGSLGRYSHAVPAFEAALRCNPSRTETWYSLGFIHSISKEYPQAASAYRKALELQPGHAMARTNLGICLMFQGNKEEAEECFRRAISDDPNLFEPRCNLATLLVHGGWYEQGLAELALALKISSRSATAAQNLIRVILDDLKEDPARKGKIFSDFVKQFGDKKIVEMMVPFLREQGLTEPSVQKLFGIKAKRVR
jgi:tetratricopeptide (TPR) repeat protein